MKEKSSELHMKPCAFVGKYFHTVLAGNSPTSLVNQVQSLLVDIFYIYTSMSEENFLTSNLAYPGTHYFFTGVSPPVTVSSFSCELRKQH